MLYRLAKSIGEAMGDLSRAAWSGIATCFVERQRSLGSSFRFRNPIKVECFRDGKLVWTDYCYNGVTNVGVDAVLNIMFGSTSKVAAWYMGLLSATPTLAAGDTMSSHAGWTEDQNYTAATRPQWNSGFTTTTSQSIANSTSIDFTMNATTTIGGIFLNSVSTKGGTTGTLFATAAFGGGNQAVVNLDVLKVTYTVTGTPS